MVGNFENDLENVKNGYRKRHKLFVLIRLQNIETCKRNENGKTTDFRSKQQFNTISKRFSLKNANNL